MVISGAGWREETWKPSQYKVVQMQRRETIPMTLCKNTPPAVPEIRTSLHDRHEPIKSLVA